MTVLWVIGNGFDLENELKSSYNDFHHWLHEQMPPSERDPENCPPWYGTLMSGNFNDGGDYTHLDLFIPFFCRLMYDLGSEKWSTLEDSLPQLDFEYAFDEQQVLDEDGDVDWYRTLYLLEFFAENVRDRLAILPNLFREWVEESVSEPLREFEGSDDGVLGKSIGSKNYAEFQKLFSVSPNRFINFNYTSTLETLYNIDPSDIIHIHGYADDSHSELRFGHGQSPIAVDQENDTPCVSALHEFQVASKKQLNFDALQNANIRFEDVTTICFYGFGFAKVDMPYIEFIAKKCTHGIPACLVTTKEYEHGFDSFKETVDPYWQDTHLILIDAPSDKELMEIVKT